MGKSKVLTAIKGYFVFVMLAIALTSVGCQSVGPDGCRLSNKDKAAINRTLEMYIERSLAPDKTARGDLFTEDAILIPPDGPPVQTREAIRAWHVEVDIVLEELAMPIAEMDGCRDLAYVHGSYEFRFVDVVRGKYVMTFRRQLDGSWLINTLIWSITP